MILYVPALAGLGEVDPFTADWHSLVGAALSTPSPAPVVTVKPASSGNWLDKALIYADKAVSFVDRNATKAVNLMDKFGQVKGKTKAAAYRVDDSYRRNVIQTPRYEGEDWVPGLPNIALIAGGIGLVVVMGLVMKRSNG